MLLFVRKPWLFRQTLPLDRFPRPIAEATHNTPRLNHRTPDHDDLSDNLGPLAVSISESCLVVKERIVFNVRRGGRPTDVLPPQAVQFFLCRNSWSQFLITEYRMRVLRCLDCLIENLFFAPRLHSPKSTNSCVLHDFASRCCSSSDLMACRSHCSIYVRLSLSPDESMVSHCNQPRDAGDVEHEHQQSRGPTPIRTAGVGGARSPTRRRRVSRSQCVESIGWAWGRTAEPERRVATRKSSRRKKRIATKMSDTASW